MREVETGQWTPIIFLSAKDQEQDLWRGIESGGDDYLVKPVSAVVLEAKLRAMRRLQTMQQRLISVSAELRAANERLQHLSELDELTGLINRRGFDRLLHQEISAACREQQPLTLVFCDLDAFKLYTKPRPRAGCHCLKRTAACCATPAIARATTPRAMAGEEFALILPTRREFGCDDVSPGRCAAC